MRLSVVLLLALFSIAVHAEWTPLQGHLKLQAQTLDERVFGLADARLKADYQPDYSSPWRFRADYQVQSLFGEDLAQFNNQIPNDDRQVFDLTHTLLNEDQTLAVHRLDRLLVSYTQTDYSIHLGRQAFSWGQGQVFNPLDLFNPFAPTAWDTEYKSGSDMLHAQWLMASGDDVSLLWVPRRDTTSNKIETNQSSFAAFWRHFAQIETHLMLAKDYEDTVFGLSLSGNWLDGQWKMDLMPTWLENGETITSGILAYHQAWSWKNRSMSGFIEAFYNGFGETQSKLEFGQLNTELQKRILRGQLFTENRHYLSLGATTEITPLSTASLTLMQNLDDTSQLLLLNGVYSLSDFQQLVGGLQIGIGDKHTEFDRDAVAYLQWALYF